VKDVRRKQGLSSAIAAFLGTIVLARMSGNQSIRSTYRFIDRNEPFLVESYKL